MTGAAGFTREGAASERVFLAHRLPRSLAKEAIVDLFLPQSAGPCELVLLAATTENSESDMIKRRPKLAFWSALAVTLYFAWSPAPPVLIENDKSQHILAFVTLTALFCWAYPKVRWFWILGSLALVGGAIEIVQALPSLHRTSDIADWYADVAAVALTILLVRLVLWTRNSRSVSAVCAD